jgi:hypothetical protein
LQRNGAPDGGDLAMTDLARRRIHCVRDHMTQEVVDDWDAMIAEQLGLI